MDEPGTYRFVFVSGTMGEELAVQALQQGAGLLRDALVIFPHVLYLLFSVRHVGIGCIQLALSLMQEIAGRKMVRALFLKLFFGPAQRRCRGPSDAPSRVSSATRFQRWQTSR